MDSAQLSAASERTPLLSQATDDNRTRSSSSNNVGTEATSIASSTVSTNKLQSDELATGERSRYDEYATIDWSSNLIKNSNRLRKLRARRGLRYKILNTFDAASGWIAVAIIGTLTACAAFLVIIAVSTVSDWKLGYCRTNPLLSKYMCCRNQEPISIGGDTEVGERCDDWALWSQNYWSAYAIYVTIALIYGLVSASATALTKCTLPVVHGKTEEDYDQPQEKPVAGKTMYMASGSGIPEIKTILSGFEIPHFLSLKVLLVKGFGAIFAVSTGMCLGKEGPFVHMSTCIGYLVGMRFPKYKANQRKIRELLSAACASGLSVAFGAPIGGVLFSYEEISTYFPRNVLWKAYLCSLFAATVLKELDPNKTGKLVIYETNYDTRYRPFHYVVFICLGVVGGIFGGVMCKANFLWAKWFRAFSAIKGHPVFEVFLVVLATAVLQYPNPLTRDPGDTILKNLLVDCRDPEFDGTFVCRSEMGLGDRRRYVGWLIHGSLVKLILTIITFGCKVPSGVIIPALDGGAFFGRLIGLAITDISPGILAMVGAGAFLAGVSRMTISFVVIMFEGIYEVAQTVAGHPFLDHENAIKSVQLQKTPPLVEELIPPKQTMNEMTVEVPQSNTVPYRVLTGKLAQLRHRGQIDSGLVLVRDSGILQGYVTQAQLELCLNESGITDESNVPVRLLSGSVLREERLSESVELDLSMYVDCSVPVISSKAPLECLIEMFGKLGLSQLCVIEDGTGKLRGVVSKKRLLNLLKGLE